MVHEPVHIVHLFTAHSVNFFEQELPVVAMFVNGLGQNEQSL
jgi:hypothetical protein